MAIVYAFQEFSYVLRFHFITMLWIWFS